MNQPPLPCSLSLCMMARNAESTLARTLQSVASIVDEILLVDTGSSDRTTEIARQFGAKILPAVWNDDFSETRNISLSAARGRWILVLDSDEWMLPKEVTALRALLDSENSLPTPEPKAFRLLNRSLASHGLGGGTAAYLTRLFPNHPEVRYQFPIHEQIDTNLQRLGFEIWDIPIEILHDGYCDPVVRLQKQQRNLQILEKQIKTEPPLPITRFLLAGCYLDLDKYNDALDAYLLTYEDAFHQKHSSVADACLVRIATCLFRLGRYQETLTFCEKIHGPAASHPELLLTHAKTLADLGRSADANVIMEKVLTLPDIPRLPPCDHGAALFEAAQWTTSEAFRVALNTQRA